jgi:EmrB/QacA subfamily drug resistance transporter
MQKFYILFSIVTKQQKLILVVAILASFVAFLDGSVINVALPAISKELGGGLTTQQWVVDAYLITLGALMLIAGSFSDLFGRKRILVIGLIGFAVTSILCAIAPNSLFLIVSRALQGVAGALLVPSSLALIISSFSGSLQAKAIGYWTAWTGIAFVIGPLLGGFFVDALSWRLIFAINIVPITITIWLIWYIKKPDIYQKNARIDYIGAILCVIGLGGPVYALIEQSQYGILSPLIYLPFIMGILSFMAFIWYEKHTSQPMLDLDLFKIRNFAIGNIATVAIYAGLSIATFLIAVFVQQTGGYSAFAAGMALLPVTIIMFLLSSHFGALAGKYGPRFFMAAGPMVAAVGFLLMLTVNDAVTYWTQLFPGIVIFGIGLAMTVAPLTSAILGSIDSRKAGVGSAVNNAISRIAGLVAIAAIGVIVGPELSVSGFHRGVVSIALLLVIGGVISAIGITNSKQSA